MSAYKKKFTSTELFTILLEEETVESKTNQIIKLLDEGANINKQFANDSGNTPLHISVINHHINGKQIINLLLQRGANINYRNNDGKTALDIAKELETDIGATIVQLLEEFEAKLQIDEYSQENAAIDISIAKHNNRQLMYNKRAGTSGIKGQLYMSKLLSLVLVRASLSKRFDEFYLGTCLDGIGSFNDVCFKYIEDDKEGMVFLKVKDVNKVKFTIKDLWREDGDFSLYEHFKSYLNIIHKLEEKNDSDPLFMLKTKNVNFTFGVYTTAEIDMNDEKLVVLNSLDETARDLICDSNCTKVYRYKYDEEDVALLTTKSLKEAMICIGKNLIRCKVTGNYDTLFDDYCIMKYHVVLAQKVIKVSEITEEGYRIGTFRKEFFYNHDTIFRCLRLILFTSYIEAFKVDKEKLSKLIDNVCKDPTVVPIGKLMKCIIPYYDRQSNILIIKEDQFKDVTCKLSQVKVCIDEYNQALELTMNKTLESLSFKLPPAFGNIDITVDDKENCEQILTHFAEELIKLITMTRNPNSIQDYKRSVINVSSMDFNKMFARAVGNLFILANIDKIYKFNTNELTLGENAKTVLGILKSRITYLDDIMLFLPNPYFPKLTLDADDKAKREVMHFFNNLQFYVCQPKEDKIEEIIKEAIQDYCITTKHDHNATVSNALYDAVYAVIHNAVQKWWMMDGKSYYLENNRDLIDKLLTDLYGKSLLNVISYKFVNRMRKYDIKFNKDAIDYLGSELESKTTILITEVNILTGIKLAQCYHNLNKYAFLDFNDITYLSRYDLYTLVHELKSIKLKTLIIFYEDVTLANNNIFLRLTDKSITKNYILVTNEMSAHKLRLYMASETYATLRDVRNDLNDLTDISQVKILDKKFLFQGEFVKFSTVLAPESKYIINAKILQKLIKNEITEIGKILTNPYYEEIKPYYIQRHLHRIMPSKESLNAFLSTPIIHKKERIKIKTLDALKDTVVIIGSPGMGKSTFLTHLSIKTKQINPEIWIERINLLDQTKDLYNLQKNLIKINQSHALKFVCKAILSKNLIRYSIKPTPTVNFDLEIKNGEVTLKNGDEIDYIVLFELEMFIYCYNQGNTILLFDGFDEICPHYKKEMIDILKCLVTRNSSDTGSSVKQRMWITSRSYNNIRETLENEFGVVYNLEMFTKYEQVIFINEYFKCNMNMRELNLDQFKNIDSFFDFMGEFVSYIPKNTGMKFYKPSTIFLQSLYFNAMNYFITEANKPLSYDKKAFIKKWAAIFKSREKHFKHFNVASNLYLFRQYYNMANELENSTLVFTPLHIYIVMEYFINQIKTNDADNQDNVTKKWDFEMSTMSFYKYFIEMKLEKIRFEMKNQMDLHNPDIRMIYKKELKEFMNEHKKLAFYTTFKDETNEILSGKNIEEIRNVIQRMVDGKEKTGIVDGILSNGIPRFIHLSFQEYLAAEYMADLLKMHQCNQLKYWRFVLSKISDGFLDFLDRRMEFDDDLVNTITDIETKKLIFNDLTRMNKQTVLDRAMDLGLRQVTKVLLRAMADVVDANNFNDYFIVTFKVFNSIEHFGWYDVNSINLNCIREVNAPSLCLLNPGFLNKRSYCKMCNVCIIRDFKWQWKRYKDMFQGRKKSTPKSRRNTI